MAGRWGEGIVQDVDAGVSAEFDVEAGEGRTFVLESGERATPVGEQEAEALMHETARAWRTWLGHSTYSGRWREMVHRYALTLKLLSYAPSGAIVAAPTTSLPEQPGGGRNWDYRYAWLRDSAFSIYALSRLGFTDEAAAFNEFLRTISQTATRPSNGDSPLQIMFRIDGSSNLEELELTHLEGYRGSRPVRIGNRAATQLQLDIYGELFDSIYLSEQQARTGRGELISYDDWRGLALIVDWLCAHWQQPDEGIWETRNGRKRFTYSALIAGSRSTARSGSRPAAASPPT